MKKSSYLVNGLMVAAIAIAVSSCSKEDDFVQLPEQQETVTNNDNEDGLIDMVFGATTAGSKSTTRSALTESNTVVWDEGDKIAIFDGTAGREFTTSSTGQYATFAGKAKKASKYYALYPYNSSATMEDGVIRNVDLPATQTAVAGSYSNNISVAYSADMNLYFKNVVSLVKISINSDNADEICKISLNTSANLAGRMEIAFDENLNPYVSDIKQESTSVSLELASGFVKGANYYMAVLPADLSDGFSVTFYNKNGKDTTKEYSGNVNMGRSSIFNLGDIKVEFMADPVAENEPFTEVSATMLPEGVDLGLPSGNIWSEFYFGASSPSDYGKLVGMGDPTGNATAFNDATPYFHNNEMPNICGTEYDVIKNIWGGGWQLPTMADLNELKEQCTWEHNVELDGVKGSWATGPNGNKIFFAYAGIRAGNEYSDQGDHASVWAGEVGGTWNYGNYPGYYDLDIFANGNIKTDGSTAWTGQSARGVKKVAAAK
jgi:hypothetical protein